MRRIRLQPPNDKKWQRWLSDCEKETQALQDAIDRGETATVKELYKRYKEFFFSDDKPFYGKCTYCECYLHRQYGDVEHFRPKGGINDELGKKINHPGYYWLAYDWQNLLISCIACNQKVKRNQFPVVDSKHAKTPDRILTEQPLLINPTSEDDQDDPAKHLKIDTTTGYLYGLTDRGRMCIQVYGLNGCDRLVDERRQACHRVKDLIALYLSNCIKKDLQPEKVNEIEQEIEEINQEKCSYWLARKTTFLEAQSEVMSKLSIL
jgi:uncharacterized protein (TIGR02646 family)